MAKELNVKVNVEGADDINKLESGIKGAKKEASTLGDTFGKVAKAAVIFTVIIEALQQVKEAMTQSQEGSDKLGQAFAFLGGLLQPVIDLIGKAGIALVNAFQQPQQAWDSFKNGIEQGLNFLEKNVWDPFLAYFDNVGLKLVGKFKEMAIATKEFFGADATQLKQELKDINAEIVKNDEIISKAGEEWSEAVDAVVESTKELGAEMQAAGKQASYLAEQRQKLERQQLAELKYNTKVKAQLEELKNIRDDESQSLEDRIAANDKLAVLEQSRVDFALKTKGQEISLLREELRLKGNNIERQTALAEAQAEYNDLVGESAGIINEQLTNSVGLRREEAELLNAQIDAQSEIAQITETSELRKTQIVLDANKAKAQSYVDLGLTETQEYRDAVIAVEVAEAEKLKAITEAQLEAVAITQEINMTATELEIQGIKDANAQKLVALEEAGMLTIELKKKLAKQEADDIKEINDTAREAERQANLESTNSKLQTAGEFVNSMSSIANSLATISKNRYDYEARLLNNKAHLEIQRTGEVSQHTINAQNKLEEERNKQLKRQFKVRKALAIAEAVVGTAQAVVQGIASAPPPYGVILGVIAGAVGAAQIAAIASERFDPGTTSRSTPPAIPNIGSISTPSVGGGTPSLSSGVGPNQSQFAQQQLFGADSESVGGEAGSRQVVKAVVVERDVTNAQETISSFNDTATIG